MPWLRDSNRNPDCYGKWYKFAVIVWTVWKIEGSIEKEVKSVFGQFYDSHNDWVKKLTVKHFCEMGEYNNSILK